MFDKEITLKTYVRSDVDSAGYGTPTESSLDLFAEKQSVTMAESYKAMQANISVSMVFHVHAIEWELTKKMEDVVTAVYATKLVYNGAIYNIVRVGEAKGKYNQMEIVCG